MRLAPAALPFFFALLSACGGDGGGGVGASAPIVTRPRFPGTAAANEPLTGYQIRAFSAATESADSLASDTADADGRYDQVLFEQDRPPFLFLASDDARAGQPQYPRLYSIALRGGTTNTTPLTSLLVARLLNRKPSLHADLRAARELQGIADADLRAAQQQVVAYLLNKPSAQDGNATSPVDVSVVTDFVSMPLTAAPGDPYFEALRRLHQSMMDSETADGIEEHMLFGNDPPADLRAMLALDFQANCTVEGMDDGTLPRGPTRITLNRRGIVFGPVDLPFQTGDQLDLRAGLTRGESLLVGTGLLSPEGWLFTLPGRQRAVEFAVKQGVLASVFLTVPSQSLSPPSQTTRCVPLAEVRLSGKHPSLIALIRLLGESITQSTFQCAAPITHAGFQTSGNTLTLQRNGVVRINAPGGPALHLPSLNIDARANLVVAAGEVQPIRIATLSASRTFPGGLDSFGVALTADGRITRLSIDRQKPQSRATQTCS